MKCSYSTTPSPAGSTVSNNSLASLLLLGGQPRAVNARRRSEEGSRSEEEEEKSSNADRISASVEGEMLFFFAREETRGLLPLVATLEDLEGWVVVGLARFLGY